MIMCSFDIFVRYSQLISEDFFKILVGIILYDPTFLLSRLMILLKILIVSVIERTLGWFSNVFIAFSTGSSKFSVFVRRDLFSIMSREFIAVLKYWF